mmetsp:Transcript_46029/g.112117  ORF Transcript_46029/g.112117 Transcript_46029/m.112117 type:complete len:373 (+) Transcript_46029:294-1412(+)
MALASQDPLGRHQPLNAHRSPHVPPVRRAHLRPQAEAVPVGKARGAVEEHARAVHLLQELPRRLVVFRHNHVRVPAAILADVIDRLIHRLHDLHGEGVRPKLHVHVLSNRHACRLRTKHRTRPRPRVHNDTNVHQRLYQLLELPVLPHAAVDKQRAHGDPPRAILYLRVVDDATSHLHVGLLVHVHVAHPIRVPQDRNLSRALDRIDQPLAASRDHHVDVLIEGKHVRHLRPRVQHRHSVGRGVASLESVSKDLVEHTHSVGGLLGTLENHRVPAGDAQSRNLRQDLRPCLEHTQHHPQRHALRLEIQPLSELAPLQILAHRLPRAVLREHLDAPDDRLELLVREHELCELVLVLVGPPVGVELLLSEGNVA